MWKSAVVLAVAVMALPQAHAAAVAGGELGFSLGASLTSDSNVVDPSGAFAAGKSDLAGALSAGASYKRSVGTSGNLSASYDFTGTRYRDVKTRNDALHLGSLTYTQLVGPAIVGGNLSYANYRMDGNAFMTLQRTSVFVGGKGWLDAIWLGSLAHARKRFDDVLLQPRDAEANSFSLSATRNAGPGKVRLSYELAQENAVADELDFRGHTLGARYTQKLALGSLPVSFKADLRYARRNYSHVDPFIGDRRTDKRSQLELALEHESATKVTYGLSLVYLDSASNLFSADYSRTTLKASIGMKF
jgi:hypothetical protein